MGIREFINKRKRTTFIAIAVVVALAVIVGLRSNQSPIGRIESAFYVHDGSTEFFVDDVDRIYPFDHNGKPAYRAYVYRGADGKPFVAYIARFTDAAKARMEELKKLDTQEAAGELAQLRSTAIEVRKHAGGNWVPLYSNEGAIIASHPTLPNGDSAQMIMP